ncbi:hypothetical protein FNV43_RR08354 [Rhamnella rubrinervis]|uniref:Uncharacterized protein n=1 Tax=Rhamnella rubrinervis TaxID=2594499 RepID=A0A8K0MN04_9ROSA|nr:hypothetical protein FNV43_RR08354 [Rhamnella rubrinervis]
MAFHSRFFPSDHEVYLGELVEARKEPDESVEKFLHRCRNKSIKYTHPLTEKESINICARVAYVKDQSPVGVQRSKDLTHIFLYKQGLVPPLILRAGPVAAVDPLSVRASLLFPHSLSFSRIPRSKVLIALTAMGLPKENCNRSLSTTHKTTEVFYLAPKGNPPGPSPTYTRGAEDNERETKS